jgi:hypothetical protein
VPHTEESVVPRQRPRAFTAPQHTIETAQFVPPELAQADFAWFWLTPVALQS